MFSNYYGIRIWRNPRERQTVRKKTTSRHSASRHLERRPRGTNLFDRLPNEIIEKMLSPLVNRDILLYDGYDPTPRTIRRLRLVSSRFKDVIDSLLARSGSDGSLHICQIGGVPFTCVAKLKEMYQVFRRDLWITLAPLLRSGRTCTAYVHFQPCSEQRDAVNWLRDDDFRTMSAMASLPNLPMMDIVAAPSKDRLGAQNAMREHYAAAVMLARIMREILQTSSEWECRLNIVMDFYEVDGTAFDLNRAFEERRFPPESMPFRDSEGLRIILGEWGQFAPRLDVLLPNIAWTFKGWIPLTVKAMIWDRCMESVFRDWRGLPAPPRRHGQQWISTRKVQAPVLSQPIVLPRNFWYSIWLTTAKKEQPEIRCMAIRRTKAILARGQRIQVVRNCPRTQTKSETSTSDPGSTTDTEVEQQAPCCFCWIDRIQTE